MEVLRRFAFNSSTSSLKERESLFEQLFQVLNSPKGSGENGKCLFANHLQLKFVSQLIESRI